MILQEVLRRHTHIAMILSKRRSRPFETHPVDVKVQYQAVLGRDRRTQQERCGGLTCSSKVCWHALSMQ